MTKKIIFFSVIAVIIIGGLGYLWYRYSQCKAEAGTPCTAAMREFTGYSVNLPPGLTGAGKTTKCNFWTGKSCS